MTGLFSPGDTRAGDLFDEPALLRAMLAVETAWLTELVECGVADSSAAVDLSGIVDEADLPGLRADTEAAGNPVPPLVTLLRARVGPTGTAAATWVHRGLTSQDVLDTALLLCARDLDVALRAELSAQLTALTAMARRHSETPMVARTLTQHAVPYTFGAKAASWLHGVLDAADDLLRAGAELPAQLGGAAGTMAAATELLAARGANDPPAAARALADRVARRLGLRPAPPWHTARAPITRLGAAWVGTTSAYGRIANDVLVLARPEIGELSEPAGRGGSSTMPQKANPVLAVLIRRAALGAPHLGAQLHLAAAEAVDERPDGGWHLEWPVLQGLGRMTATAARQVTELLAGLRVHPERMRANLESAGDGVRAEQRSMAELTATPPAAAYDGAGGLLVDAVCCRADRLLEQLR